jgi:hypothetical protein
LSDVPSETGTRHLIVFFTNLHKLRKFALYNPEIWIDSQTPLLCVLHSNNALQSAAISGGAQDIGDADTGIVLLRELGTESVDERTLYETLVEQGFSPSRVLLMRSRVNLMSCGYAFVDFETVEEASQFIAKTLKGHLLSVGSAQVRDILSRATAHSIHMRVFKPVEPDQPVSYCCKNLAGNYMYYWDLSLYPAEYGAERNQTLEDLEKYHEQTAVIPSVKKRKLDIPNPLSLHKAPEVLKTWQSRQQELQPRARQDIPELSNLQKSFADTERKTCVLCLRKFKSTHELNSHERNSQLHLYNLTVDTKVKKAEVTMEFLKSTAASN